MNQRLSHERVKVADDDPKVPFSPIGAGQAVELTGHLRQTTVPPMPPKRAAGVVVVYAAGADRPLFLLLRAYRNWDLPKGLVEPGEEPFAAAVREVEEETGLTDLEFAWGRDYVETERYSGNKIARFYVARTSNHRITLRVNPTLGRPEHHEYRWCDLDAASALVVPRLQRVLAWAADKIARGSRLAHREDRD